MFVFNIILGLCLFVALFLTVRRGRALKKISAELEVVLQNLKDLNVPGAAARKDGNDPLADPGMLSTLLTAIVNKYGTITLNIQDFTELCEGDYVSVYADGTEQNLILSLDHNLTSDDPMRFVNFGKMDDTTFH